MTSFQHFNLPNALSSALVSMQYTTPTPVQAQAIPIAMKGQDLLSSAQTGTGKTGAFAIPVISQLMQSDNECAIVLTPTRELAVQVFNMMEKLLSQQCQIQSALLIGGEPISRQFKQLKRKPRLIVGTPGRIIDHLGRKSINLSKTKMLVLDETDRMLDMGFSVQIDEIIKCLPKTRQTLMFSATIPKKIAALSRKYLSNPQRIQLGESHVVADNIEQKNIHVCEKTKFDTLTKELDTREGAILVFVKTKRGADLLAKKLNSQSYRSNAIHGDLHQRKRETVIQAFRAKKYRIMVATDVASRGLDISHIRHVINYDMPQCPQDYIHRIGRTARAGEKGASLNLISQRDKRIWQAIRQFITSGKESDITNPKPSRKKRFSKKPSQNFSKKTSHGGPSKKPSQKRRGNFSSAKKAPSKKRVVYRNPNAK